MKKYKKSYTKTMNWKYQLRRGMRNLNYLMDHIIYIPRRKTEDY